MADPAMIPMLILAVYRDDAWTDPWGNKHFGYVVEDFAMNVEDTGLTEPHDYGYGPKHVVQGNTTFKAIPPMDYASPTAYQDLETGKFWYKPVKGVNYVLDGKPWLTVDTTDE
jgi:hypothetical protein